MGDMEQFEDLLLRSARNGDCKTVEEILQARKDGKVNLYISCKGKIISTPFFLLSPFICPSIQPFSFLPLPPFPISHFLPFCLPFCIPLFHSHLPALPSILCPFLSLFPFLSIQASLLPLFLSTFLPP